MRLERKWTSPIGQPSLVVLFALTLFTAATAATEGQQQTNFSNLSWTGHYRHSSGKFELILNQFAKDSLAVDILPIPRSDHNHESHFFALIDRGLAILSDKREPNCRVEMKKVSRGIFVSDHCNGAGDDAGLYIRLKDKVGT